MVSIWNIYAINVLLANNVKASWLMITATSESIMIIIALKITTYAEIIKIAPIMK